ncbi:DUF3800 domain-containing protein [Streptomyces mobaraensis]|uniref:DUF3800 domain-containing protein n=1 Tax=Streptomyces mobaraensis TaxID=35621 RepID=UPI003325D737
MEVDRITEGSIPRYTYYMDESGFSGMSVIGWLAIAPGAQQTVREHLLGFREKLAADPVLPIPFEWPLHAVDLAGGRGAPLHMRPGHGPDARMKEAFREVIARVLDELAGLSGVSVGAVYRRHATREQLYRDLVPLLNARHAALGIPARIHFDGNGTEQGLKRAHRGLPDEERYIDRELVLEPSWASPLLQAADLVAYTAFQSVIRRESRHFLWDWYARRLPEAEGPYLL